MFDYRIYGEKFEKELSTGEKLCIQENTDVATATVNGQTSQTIQLLSV